MSTTKWRKTEKFSPKRALWTNYASRKIKNYVFPFSVLRYTGGITVWKTNKKVAQVNTFTWFLDSRANRGRKDTLLKKKCPRRGTQGDPSTTYPYQLTLPRRAPACLAMVRVQQKAQAALMPTGSGGAMQRKQEAICSGCTEHQLHQAGGPENLLQPWIEDTEELGKAQWVERELSIQNHVSHVFFVISHTLTLKEMQTRCPVASASNENTQWMLSRPEHSTSVQSGGMTYSNTT